MSGTARYGDDGRLPSLAEGVHEMTAIERGTRVHWSAFSITEQRTICMSGTVRQVGKEADPVVKLELDPESAAHVRNARSYTQRLSTLSADEPLPADLEALAGALLALAGTRDELQVPTRAIEAARQARLLADHARTLIQQFGYEAIYWATRGMTRGAVAHELGEKESTIHYAVGQHARAIKEKR